MRLNVAFSDERKRKTAKADRPECCRCHRPYYRRNLIEVWKVKLGQLVKTEMRICLDCSGPAFARRVMIAVESSVSTTRRHR